MFLGKSHGGHLISIFLFGFDSNFLEISRSILTLSLRVPDVASNLCLKKCVLTKEGVWASAWQRGTVLCPQLPRLLVRNWLSIASDASTSSHTAMATSIHSPTRQCAVELILYARHYSRQREGMMKR